ncbi:unnamed protein product [Owenia fusiformis]|uniref:Uncharacterized protein n=1 Tax=Owenia fusiformis TaxID=6347 RepID=A0A8J1UUW5_OWEFU|nr:unnamed protein product [Owenia fusiformis]
MLTNVGNEFAAMESNNTTIAPTESPVVHYQKYLVGCGLAIGGNLLISLSLNVQKYSHMRNDQRIDPIHYTKDPLWWFGLILMTVGEVGNFAAYGFAPASLVAPLGMTTVVANMFIAVIMLKEKLRPEDMFGCTLAILGAFLIVNFSKRTEIILSGPKIVEFLTQIAFIVYMVVELIMLTGLLVLKYKYKKNNVILLLLITSLLASLTVISAKAVSGMLQLTFSGVMQLQYVIFWVMIVILAVTAVAQLKYLNQAIMAHDSTVVVPTNFVFFTISAIIAGIIFYRELWGLHALNVFMFLFGCFLCFTGVYFITAGKEPTPPVSEDEQPLTEKKLVQQILPTWWFSDVNQIEVQPRSCSEQQYMTRPIIPREESSGTEDTSFDDTPNISHDPPNGKGSINYGTTTETAK